MAVNSAKLMGDLSSYNKLGMRLDLGVSAPKKINEENMYKLFKDIFFYQSNGLYVKEFQHALNPETIESEGIDIEEVLKQYEVKYPSYQKWSIEKKWYGLILSYFHYLLTEAKQSHLTPVIDLLLNKSNEDVELVYLINYVSIINHSVSMFEEFFLLPRFTSILDIKAESLYEDMYANNLTLFLDYQKEFTAVMRKHLTIKDLPKELYGSSYYNKWSTLYDMLIEDLYNQANSIQLFLMNNLSEEDFVDLKSILTDDLFGSLQWLDIENETLNALLDDLSTEIVEVFKNHYVLETERENPFEEAMKVITLEFKKE